MKKQNLQIDYVFDLINAFKVIKSVDESVLFLQDILTANEIKNLSIRLRIAKLLLSGQTQRNICIDLHVSIATVSKVNSWLSSKGQGFKNVIQKLPTKYDIPAKPLRGPIEFHLPELILSGTQYVIASSQNSKVNKLISSAKDKAFTDKLTKEKYSDRYKHKTK